MQVLKLEQNLFLELGKLNHVKETTKGDSVFRTIPVDFLEDVEQVTVEKKKYPFFYKYYLYFGEDFANPESLREERGAQFLISFYQKFCPNYVKNPIYDKNIGMKPDMYFHMEIIPGEAMQHFVAGEGAVEEISEEKNDVQGYFAMEGYHMFSEEEKKDVSSQLDALKDQLADQMKELEALMGKKVN